MGKQYNPLEKEFLIRTYKNNPGIKRAAFCSNYNISITAFSKWLAQYEEAGLAGLAGGSKLPDILPEGMDRTEENYKREIIKLRIENERLKKNYSVRTNPNGETTYIRLKEKNSK